MGKTTQKLAGPGRLGSAKAVKDSLKGSGGGNKNIRSVPPEAKGSITARFLDEPEDFFGYYEHWENKSPYPCTEPCERCDSDDPEVRRRSFRYLANAYIVDDQKVVVLKLPSSLVEILMNYYKKYDGTLLDRDYELSRTGSGQMDTKYFAAPDAPRAIKLSRFDSKKFDLEEIAGSLVDGADEDEDDEPPKKKKVKKQDPWEDSEDEVKPKKKKGKGKSASKPVVKKKVAKKSVAKPVKKTVKRKK
jgi:hypothetical protein